MVERWTPPQSGYFDRELRHAYEYKKACDAGPFLLEAMNTLVDRLKHLSPHKGHAFMHHEPVGELAYKALRVARWYDLHPNDQYRQEEAKRNALARRDWLRTQDPEKRFGWLHEQD